MTNERDIDTTTDWVNKVRQAVTFVEDAIAKLFELGPSVTHLCNAVTSSGFDFAAVQLIRPRDQVIETVDATGSAIGLIGLAKHPLHPTHTVRDIQADIATSNPPRIEIISGPDTRLDQWLFERFGHRPMRRIWLPILVASTNTGDIVHNWYDHAHWKADKSAKSPPTHISLILDLSNLTRRGITVECHGTLEAGCLDATHHGDISIQKARALARTVAKHSQAVYTALLPLVLQSIANTARRLLGADDACLYFAYNDQSQRYAYQVFSGQAGTSVLRNIPPRPNGLGMHAVNLKRPQYLPSPVSSGADQETREIDPRLLSLGVQATAAFPLIVPPDFGVLYFHFRRPHDFSEDEIKWANIFAARVETAIRYSTHYTDLQAQARNMYHLHAINQWIVENPEDPHLLRDVAETIYRLLDADEVFIYDCSQDFGAAEGGRTFRSYGAPNNTAQTKTKTYESIAANLPRSSVNIYRSDNSGYSIEDGVQSYAHVVLRSLDAVAGVILIHFFDIHDFTQSERSLIETLAASAAIALRNRSLIEQRKAANDARDMHLQTLRHEIRAPLDMVLADAEWLGMVLQPSTDADRTLRDRKVSAIQDNVAIVSMLARGSNALEQDFSLSTSEINVTESVIRPIIKAFQRSSRHQGIEIDWQYLGLPPVLADQQYTMMVFYNGNRSRGCRACRCRGRDGMSREAEQSRGELR